MTAGAPAHTEAQTVEPGQPIFLASLPAAQEAMEYAIKNLEHNPEKFPGWTRWKNEITNTMNARLASKGLPSRVSYVFDISEYNRNHRYAIMKSLHDSVCQDYNKAGYQIVESGFTDSGSLLVSLDSPEPKPLGKRFRRYCCGF